MDECEIDLRVGGSYRYVWRNVADGMEMGMGGVYPRDRAGRAHRRHREVRSGVVRGDAIGTLTFVEENGRTTLTITGALVRLEDRFATPCWSRGWNRAWRVSYDNLANLLTHRRRVTNDDARNRTTPLDEQLAAALASLERAATQHDRDNLARFGITTADQVLGVSMANIQKIAKTLGRSHALAEALWETGCYEARMLTAFVDEPARVTPAQMDRWCRDFDNWGICDTLCFKLFDRTPHAWGKVDAVEQAQGRVHEARRVRAPREPRRPRQDVRRRAVPRRAARSSRRASTDERNFVKKGVSWALRRIGTRSAKLHAAAVAVAQRLAASKEGAPRWIGKDALRELLKR